MLFSLLLLRLVTCDESNELSIKIETLAKEIEELSKSVEKLKELIYGRQYQARSIPKRVLRNYERPYLQSIQRNDLVSSFGGQHRDTGLPSSHTPIGNSSILS